jgi:hypothetical protein
MGMMTKKQVKYEVLRNCENHKTGKEYKPGDIIDASAFTAAVIKNFLAHIPPVLRKV